MITNQLWVELPGRLEATTSFEGNEKKNEMKDTQPKALTGGDQNSWLAENRNIYRSEWNEE